MSEEKDKEISRSLSFHAWKKLKKNKLAMAGMIFICFAIIIAILGSLVRPDSTVDADNQIPPIAKKKPGFEVNLLYKKKNREVPSVSFTDRMLFGGQELEYEALPFYSYKFEGANIVIERFNDKKGKPGYTPNMLSLPLADIVFSLHHNPNYSEDLEKGTVSFYNVKKKKITKSIKSLRKQVKEEQMEVQTYWLGTDIYGRDMLSRLMGGAIVSLMVGFISVIISLVIGISLGAIAGFFKGWVDDLIMWLINVVWSIPTLLLVIAITLALGKGFVPTFIAVGFTMWVEVARIVRGQVLSVREKEFIEAGRALGYNSPRLIIRHVLPNVMGPVIIISAANFASAILIEAGLSFLGIGAQVPTPSWGQMISAHKGYLTSSDLTYLAILPGVCIILMVLAFMLVGNGLRDALDTKSVDDVNPAG
jgi:peptide/nickel transport system permease protein